MRAQSSSESVAEGSGFFGKLPNRGDFIGRRLPLTLIDRLTTWLDAGLATSRAALGDGWLETYLSSPVWRFALSAGVLDSVPLCGILFPSVDRVGRFYPFTVLVRLAVDAGPAAALIAAESWFEAAERLALPGLEGGFDFDGFDTALAGLVAPTVVAPSAAVGTGLETPRSVMRGQDVACLFDRVARLCWPQCSVWCTAGSIEVRACLRVYPGLPSHDDFASLLRWQPNRIGAGGAA